MAKRPRIPKYSLHKPSGRARVILNGRHIFLGKYGSDESRAHEDDHPLDPHAIGVLQEVGDFLSRRVARGAQVPMRVPDDVLGAIRGRLLALRRLSVGHAGGNRRLRRPDQRRAPRDSAIG